MNLTALPPVELARQLEVPQNTLSAHLNISKHAGLVRGARQSRSIIYRSISTASPQIDWIPLSIGAVRPTKGKTLAQMQVSGGSQSFNACCRFNETKAHE